MSPGLDWGQWSPERIYYDLPSPKETNQVMVDAAYDDNLVVFVREYRRVNPGISISEANSDFSNLRSLITAAKSNKDA